MRTTMQVAAVVVAVLSVMAAVVEVRGQVTPALGYLRVTPDPGVLVDHSTTSQLKLDFNQPIQEAASGNFTIKCPSSGAFFTASVRSPQAWVRDATVTLLLPAGLLMHAGECTVVVPAGAYVSSANGSPSPLQTWSFTAGPFVAPGHSVSPPSAPAHASVVRPLNAQLDASRVNSTIAHLSTAWDNRFFNDATGEAAAEWLVQSYQDLAAAAGRDDVNVSLFRHAWRMPSVVVHIPGTDAALADETVVVGGHLDSINRQNWTVNVRTGHAPGANDDASAIALHLEVFRVLMASPGVRFRRGVELHAYAGEEEGLYGSLDVSAAYARDNRTVAAMLQLDQCSYVADPKHPVMAVFTDNTDPPLSRLLTQLIDAYCTTPWVWSNEDDRADSDFHSWTMHGYRAAYAAEGVIDDLVYGNSKHTPYDVISTINLAHAMEFGRLALGFIVEMAL